MKILTSYPSYHLIIEEMNQDKHLWMRSRAYEKELRESISRKKIGKKSWIKVKDEFDLFPFLFYSSIICFYVSYSCSLYNPTNGLIVTKQL